MKVVYKFIKNKKAAGPGKIVLIFEPNKINHTINNSL